MKLVTSKAFLPTVPPDEFHNLMESRGNSLHAMEPSSAEDDIVRARGADHNELHIDYSGIGMNRECDQTEGLYRSARKTNEW